MSDDMIINRKLIFVNNNLTINVKYHMRNVNEKRRTQARVYGDGMIYR